MVVDLCIFSYILLHKCYHHRYDVWQPELYGRIAACANGKVYYSQGMPSLDETMFLDSTTKDTNNCSKDTTVLLIDDLFHLMTRKDFAGLIHRIWTTLSHHHNITCYLLTQSIFGNKNMPIIYRNTKYIILTKAHHDYGLLGRVFTPSEPSYLRLAAQTCFYELNRPYLVIDNHSSTHPSHRCKTGFIKGEQKYIFSSVQ